MPRRYGSTSWNRKIGGSNSGAFMGNAKVGGASKVNARVKGLSSSSGKVSEPTHDAQVASAVKRSRSKLQQGVPAGNYVRDTKHRVKA